MFKRFLVSLLIVSTIFTSVPTTAFAAGDISPDETIEQTQEAEEDVASEDAGDENTDENIGGSTETQSQEAIVTEAVTIEEIPTPAITETVSEQSPSENIATPTEEVKEDEGTTPSEETGDKKDDGTLANADNPKSNEEPEEAPVAVEKPVMMMSSGGLYGASYARIEIKDSDDGNAKRIKDVYNLKVGTPYTVEEFVSIRYTVTEGYEITGATITYYDSTPTKTLDINDSFTIDKKFIFKPITQAKSNKCTITFANATGVTANTESIQVEKGESILVSDLLKDYYTTSEDYKVTSANVKKDGNSNVGYNVTESFTADANKITLTPISSKRDKYEVSIYILSGEHGHYKDSNVTSYYVYDSNRFTVTTDKVAEFVEPDDGYKLVGFEVGMDSTLYTSKQITVYSNYYPTYIYPVFELDGVRNLIIDFNGGTNAAGETSHTYEINRTDSFYFATNSDYIKDVTRTGYKVSSYTINGEKYTGIKEIKAGKDDVKITLNWSELPKNTYTIKLQGTNNDKLSFKDSNDTAFYVYQGAGNKVTIDVDALNSKLNVEKGYEIYGFQLDSLSSTYLYSESFPYKKNTNHNVYPLVREAVTDVNFRDCESIIGKVTPGAKLDLQKGDEITLNKEFANAHFTMKDNGYEIIGFEVYDNINVGPVSTVNDLNANTKLTLTADHYYVYPLLQEKTYNITIHLEGATVDGKDTYVIPNQGANTNFTLTTDNVNNLSNYVAKPNAELAGFYTGTDSNVKTSLTFKNLTSDVDVYLKWDDVRIIKDFVTKSITFDGKGHNWTEFVEDDSLNQISDLSYSAMAFDGNDAYNLVEPGTYKIFVACASSNVKFAFENPYVKDGVPQKTAYVFEVTIEAPKTHQVIVDYNGGVNPQGDTSSKYTVDNGSKFTKSIDDYNFVKYEGYKLVGFEVDGATVDTLDITVNADTNVKLVWAKTYTITVNVSNYKGEGYKGQPKFTEEVAEGDTFTFDYSNLDIAKYYAVHSVKVDGSWQWSDLEKQFKLDDVKKDYTVDITISPKDYHILLKKADGNKDLIIGGTGCYDRSFDDLQPLVDFVNEKITFKDHYSLDVLTCDGDDVTGLSISELITSYEADSQDIIYVYVSAKEDPKRTITVDYNGGLNPQNEKSSMYIEYVGVNFEKSVNDYNFVKYEGYELVGFEVDGIRYETLSFKVEDDTSVKLVWEIITNPVVINLPEHVTTYNDESQIIEYVPYGAPFTLEYSDLYIDKCYELTQLYIMGSPVGLGDKIYIDSVKETIFVGLDAEPIEYTIEFVGGDDHCHGKTVNSFTATINKDNGYLDEDLISRYIDCDEHFYIDNRIASWNGLNYSDADINKMLIKAYEDKLTTLTIKVYTIEEEKYPVTINSLDTYSQNKTYESYYNDKFTFPDKSDLGFSNPRELMYFDDGNGNQYKTGDTITVDGGLNFDCIWEPFEYSIEIDYNGVKDQFNGETSRSITYMEEEPVSILIEDFNDIVVKEGYHIKGFEKVNDNGTTSYVGNCISYPMGLTSDVKYNIVWEINTYEFNIHLEGVTFDGKTDIHETNVEYGTKLAFPKSHFEGTEGKVLTVVEINGVNVYTADFDVYADDFVFENITEDTDVLLVWEYLNYVVRFVPEENCKLINSDVDFYYFTIEDIVSISENDIEQFIESNDDNLYEFDHFEIDGQSYQFISWPNLTRDVIVKVFYDQKMVTVTYESDDATVTVPTNDLVWGSEYTIDVTDIEKHITTPDGYELSYFEINGEKYGSNESMYYPCLEDDLTVKAYYEKKNATITYTCTLPDSLTINDTATYGSTYSIDSDKILEFYTLPEGFYIDYFEVDGVKYEADKVCTIDNINKDKYNVHVGVDTYKYTITYVPEDNCKLLDEAYNSQKWSFGNTITIDNDNEIKYIVGPLNENCEYAYFTINDDPTPRTTYKTSGKLEDVTVHVYYTRKQCEVSYTCINGSVIDGGKVTIPMGDNYTVDANEIAKYTKANDGCKFDSFEVDGVTYKANESCEIKNITEAKEVKVNFVPVFTIKFVAEDNCKLIDSSKDEIVALKTEQVYVNKSVIDEFIVGNDDTYVLDYFTLDDGTYHYDSNYSIGFIGNFAKDVNTIHVYYKKLAYDVNFSNDGNATLKSGANAKTTYEVGSKVVIDRDSIEEIFEPVEGYKLDSFTVNGTKYTLDETFTLDSIDSNVEVVANYAKITFTITIDLNGGVDPDNTVTLVNTVEYGDKFVTPNLTKVVKEHFEITEVVVTDSKGNVVTDQPAAFEAVKENYNAKLIWTQNEFVITFDPGDHGKLNSSATNNYYSYYLSTSIQSLSYNIDVEEGWYIDYFTLNDDTSNQYEYYWEYTTEDVVVHVHYSQIMETITLKANNGIDTDKTFDVPYGDYTVTECDFKAPSGKEFDYWKVEIKGIPLRPLLGSGINPVDGMKVKPGDVIFVKGDVTLVAIYKDKPNDPKPDDPKPNDPTPNDPTPNGPTPNGTTPNGNVPANGGIISWILPQTGGVDVSWYAVIIPAVSLIAIGSALLAFLKKKSNKEQN